MTEPVAGIERVMPLFDATRVERRPVVASSERAFALLRVTDFMSVHTPLMDAAMWVRGAPARLRGRDVPPPPSMPLARLFDEPPDVTYDTTVGPWLPLVETPGRELVLGVVGRFWGPEIAWRRIDPEEFATFAEPGWGSIAVALTVEPTATGTSVLTYEARTRVHDQASRRSFLRYWSVVAPFVGHIQRALLRDVAERAAQPAA